MLAARPVSNGDLWSMNMMCRESDGQVHLDEVGSLRKYPRLRLTVEVHGCGWG